MGLTALRVKRAIVGDSLAALTKFNDSLRWED